jgi:hypothetical protein
MRGIERLMAVAPPPKTKKGSGIRDQWDELERIFNLKFPNDFKELIATYGAGRFANFFGVANPFYTSAGDITFQEFVQLRTRDINEAKVSYPKTAVHLSVYPEKNGLFPWGYTDNGETMCWLTEGDSSHWPVICLEVGYLNNYDRFDLSIVEFIGKWLTNEISVPTLTPPDFYPLKSPVFCPSVI